MTDVAIRVQGLGKRYRIRHRQQERYVALRDVIVDSVRSLLRSKSTDRPEGSSIEEFWALRDVSFEFRQGEIVGIIGKNGAGKSTLLKILSRITEPSTGRVELFGRVSSLLEVGTGFHPELTGRENIFLNGGILGMSRLEIRRRFDEIVDFAETARFLDTPVKRYSSGMYVRLAFAVAAHLQSDILIVDEVLAVGDEEFQKKCLNKMGDVSKGGRTVILVSHDLRKVASLCERGILLDAGGVEADGSVTEVIATYLGRQGGEASYADLSRRGDRSGSGEARFLSIELLSSDGSRATFPFGSSFVQRIKIEVCERFGGALIQSLIKTNEGVAVYEFVNTLDQFRWDSDVGMHVFDIEVDALLLYPGAYSIDLWLATSTSGRVDYILEAIRFNIIQSAESGISYTLDRNNALVRQPAHWRRLAVQ